MHTDLFGNTQGLHYLARRRLENLYNKKVDAASIVDFDRAHTLMQLSREIGRQVGLLVNRRGVVEAVIVGDRQRLEVPPLATERAGRARFRGIRLIHTHLGGELLSKEDLTDLAMLQLDLVACITQRAGEPVETIHIGHLVPENSTGQAWDFIGPLPINELDMDFTEFITELEGEFIRERGSHFVTARGEEQQALLVMVVMPGRHKNLEERIAELKDLCRTAGLDPIDVVVQRPKELHPKYLIGKGKIEEIVIKSQQMGADTLVFDEELFPGQIHNITSLTELKVIDRSQLILDIFASRATTNDAKLQVELAQLRYILPRLIGKGTAMSRLMGGIGGRGPGETKLEVDRRRVRARIGMLERRLKDVRKVREQKRERRRGAGIPVVSIVGYTNSGKSTLLNLLTKSEVEAQNRPFSTLSPTTRVIKYPERKNIILTDTVGFIEDLPKVLLRAFAATLEELDDATMLLHLVDISAPDFEEKIEAVEKILTELNLVGKRRLLVFNKIDRIDPHLVRLVDARYNAVSISCLNEEGIERLVRRIETEVAAERGIAPEAL